MMAQEHLATVDLMRLTDLLHDAREQLAALTSERDRLAEALEPFASAARRCKKRDATAETYSLFVVGDDFRTARAALDKDA